VLVVLFVIWWIYAFLNDDQGRLWRWTDGKYGKIPAAVQKARDEERAAAKASAEVKPAAEKAAAEVAATNTPAPPK
jgi:hypothetical protein